jgi:MFS family permease
MTTATAGASARAKLGALVVPLLALAIFINYVDRGNLATAGPLIKDEFALSATDFGQLIAAFSWTYVAAMPLAGWASERIGAYRTMAIGLAIWSLATLLTGFASGFAMLFALRLALGFGESVAFPCSSKIIAEHVPHHRLGFANSLISQGLSLGSAFGIFFGGMLMGQFGWRQVFLMFGAVSLLWLVPGSWPPEDIPATTTPIAPAHSRGSR